VKKILPNIGLVFGCLFWGASFYQVKEAMAEIQPLAFNAIRMLGGAFLIGTLALILKRNLLQNLKEGLILGILLSIVMISQTMGLKLTTASNSGFITGMFIVFVPVFSFLVYRKRSSFLKIIAIAVNLAGLWILTGGLTKVNPGDMLTIITAVFAGMHIVYISEITKLERIDPYVLCFHQFLVTGIISFFAALVSGNSFHPGSGHTIALVSYIILVPTTLSFVLQLKTQKYLSTVRAALLLTSEPVFAAAFAWTLGGEKLIPFAAVGGFIMVGGMVISELPEKAVRLK
jgi:drug/metabolite transporter (DMT)-like permease